MVVFDPLHFFQRSMLCYDSAGLDSIELTKLRNPAEEPKFSFESKPDMFRIADKVFSWICSFVDVVAKS